MSNSSKENYVNLLQLLLNPLQLIATAIAVPALTSNLGAGFSVTPAFPNLPLSWITAPAIAFVLLWGVQVAFMSAYFHNTGGRLFWLNQEQYERMFETNREDRWASGVVSFIFACALTGLLMRSGEQMFKFFCACVSTVSNWFGQAHILVGFATPLLLLALLYGISKLQENVARKKAGEKSETPTQP